MLLYTEGKIHKWQIILQQKHWLFIAPSNSLVAMGKNRK